ncbi:MAG TPA: hypothetical protein VGB20_05530 [bacterium]
MSKLLSSEFRAGRPLRAPAGQDGGSSADTQLDEEARLHLTMLERTDERLARVSAQLDRFGRRVEHVGDQIDRALPVLSRGGLLRVLTLLGMFLLGAVLGPSILEAWGRQEGARAARISWPEWMRGIIVAPAEDPGPSGEHPAAGIDAEAASALDPSASAPAGAMSGPAAYAARVANPVVRIDASTVGALQALAAPEGPGPEPAAPAATDMDEPDTASPEEASGVRQASGTINAEGVHDELESGSGAETVAEEADADRPAAPREEEPEEAGEAADDDPAGDVTESGDAAQAPEETQELQPDVPASKLVEPRDGRIRL